MLIQIWDIPTHFSHSVQWFSLWDVYRYRAISHSSCSSTAIYGSIYIICELIVWENTNGVHFSCDMGKYSTCPPKGSLYSLDECCISPYHTQMSTVCISPNYLLGTGECPPRSSRFQTTSACCIWSLHATLWWMDDVDVGLRRVTVHND